MAAQIAIGKDIPNLKITLGNSDRSEEGELTSDDSENDVIKNKEIRSDVRINRTISNIESFRVYENKGGGFITGLDMSYEVLSKKLEDRAARFGLQERPKTITQEDIDKLYNSLKVHLEDVNLSDDKRIRSEAIHMRGVEEMSTKDVIEYFKEFGPSFVEWIDDISCNVVWLDKISAARALLSLSEVLIQDKMPKETIDNALDENRDTSMLEEESPVIYISSEELNEFISGNEEMQVEQKTDDKNPEMSMDVEIPPASDSVENQENSIPEKRVDVPVPPGHWRIGIPHGKSKAILLRFATKNDKKMPGAEKRSQYYQKYGNPNYGGMRGLITTTRKRKMQAAKQKIEFEHQTAKNITETPPNIEERKKLNPVRRRKALRLRMHADDEEERMRRNRQHNSNSDRSSIYDRLGSFEERPQFAPRIVSSRQWQDFEEDIEEEDDLNTSMKSTVSRPGVDPIVQPSRYDIWTSLAKSMSSDSMEPLNRRRSPVRFLERRDTRDRINVTFHQQESKPSVNKNFTGDLRSKLQKLKATKSVSRKHRSPLAPDSPSESSEEESD